MFALVTAAGAALVSAGYQSLAPTGQWFGRAFCQGRRGSKQIAFTFDDGPNDPHTLNLLDILSRHNVRATFFLIGRYVRQRPDIVTEIAQRGHVIGNHTFTHPLLTFQSASRIRRELLQCRDAINDAVGAQSNLFRPPWGGRRPAVFRIARQMGLDPVMWNITGYDWKAPTPEFIEQKVAPRIRGGDVILLHDGGHLALGTDRSATIAAVDNLLTQFKENYEFVTIPEMMSSRT
jgi:peptidoglycan/xylan/chitin deacetylase (PgdA/CDA1 family)